MGLKGKGGGTRPPHIVMCGNVTVVSIQGVGAIERQEPHPAVCSMKRTRSWNGGMLAPVDSDTQCVELLAHQQWQNR